MEQSVNGALAGMWGLSSDVEKVKYAHDYLTQTIDYIKNGTSMLIFPEGKRNLGEGVDIFQGGSFKLTQKTGARIVPFSITNTREVWERQFPWLSRQKVTLEFLPPISTAELTRDEQKELPEKVRVIVEESFRKNGGK